MKKSNIAFSGFMAAILFSVGAANAATTQIASKQYVDNRETSILQTVSNTYETKENVTNLTEQVTQLGDTINNEDTGLAAKVDDAAAAAAEAKQTADTAQSTATGAQSAVEALGATVGNAEAGLVKDVNDLETTVGQLWILNWILQPLQQHMKFYQTRRLQSTKVIKHRQQHIRQWAQSFNGLIKRLRICLILGCQLTLVISKMELFLAVNWKMARSQLIKSPMMR